MSKVLDWNQYLKIAADTVAEGIVMLKNEKAALPLDCKKEIAVFGRIQFHYYKSGTGSGGMVNVSKVIGITEGLRDCGIKINEEVYDVYQKWDKENPFDVGQGWGMEPWCQKEMPLEESLIKKASQTAETAIVIIGRTAGEEQDNHEKAGSYLLTETEKEMLFKVRKEFKKVVVLLNTGNIIEMDDLEKSNADAILYVWQGGMVGGTGTAQVLTGKVSPSGKLTDTIAYHVSDYYADKNFGDEKRNFYQEDIYVGYRYFETFAKEKVRYPFGYGLSYTEFAMNTETVRKENNTFVFEVRVKNIGNYTGKEVAQIYCEAPQGKLGKASRVLCGFQKTKLLKPNEEQILEIKVQEQDIASYDDSGITENRFCFVIEQGEYSFYVGSDVREAVLVYKYENEKLKVISKHLQALAPVERFQRIHPVQKEQKMEIKMEEVPVSEINESERRIQNLPEEIKQTGDLGIKLGDVYNGKKNMQEFIAQFSDEELAQIVRAEGMNSPRVTAGTASAFGGVSQRLEKYGIPAGCCDDGPSGMRLDCGTKAFSLPNGTMIASTFNTELICNLYELVGLEMSANKVDCLLGPGMNIHRHPLNGRNFEYFSEDPYLTGKMAVAQLKGMQKSGVTGTIKHFCANNQETYRHTSDAVVSERALREIYLKGFEMAVREGNADSVMTTYGSVNGLWTASSFDLTTQILHNEWGFTGLTMTDWWANINERNKPVDKSNFAAMVKAQNDVYMVCADAEKNEDNIMEALQNGSLLRSELQRNAKNICNFLLHTNAMKRLLGCDETVEIMNRPVDVSDVDDADVQCYHLGEELEISLEDVNTEKGSNFSLSLDVDTLGEYQVIITAASSQSELAQIPVTIFRMGTAYGTFTWNGTNGKPVSFEKEIPFESRFTMIRLYFAQSGLDMKSIVFRRLK